MSKFNKKKLDEINGKLPAFRKDLHKLMQQHGLGDLFLTEMRVRPAVGGELGLNDPQCINVHCPVPGQQAKWRMTGSGVMGCKCIFPD